MIRSSSGRVSTGEVAGDVGVDDEDAGVCLWLAVDGDARLDESADVDEEAAGPAVVAFMATPFRRTSRSRVDAVAVLAAAFFFFFVPVADAFAPAPDVVAGGVSNICIRLSFLA